MKEKVRNTIIKYNLIESGDRLVLGVSGGPDSLSMLQILYELKNELNFDICVAHINHSLRDAADEEEQFVKDSCEKLGIVFYSLKVDVKKEAEAQKQKLLRDSSNQTVINLKWIEKWDGHLPQYMLGDKAMIMFNDKQHN